MDFDSFIRNTGAQIIENKEETLTIIVECYLLYWCYTGEL